MIGRKGPEPRGPRQGSGWGAGGPPGLQIRSGGGNVSGGFDSLTLPPSFIPSEARGIEARSPLTSRKKSARFRCARQGDEPAHR